jgi:hypothetical protein
MPKVPQQPPNCPVCACNDDVAWLSRVRGRTGEVVAARWVCKYCQAMFTGHARRYPSMSWIVVAAIASMALPSLWWHYQDAAWTERTA